MIERYPGRPQQIDEPARRPGTKALRIALLGIPGGIIGIAVAMTIQSNWAGDGVANGAVSLAVWLLGVISIAAVLAGLVGLFIGAWKRLS